MSTTMKLHRLMSVPTTSLRLRCTTTSSSSSSCSSSVLSSRTLSSSRAGGKRRLQYHQIDRLQPQQQSPRNQQQEDGLLQGRVRSRFGAGAMMRPVVSSDEFGNVLRRGKDSSSSVSSSRIIGTAVPIPVRLLTSSNKHPFHSLYSSNNLQNHSNNNHRREDCCRSFSSSSMSMESESVATQVVTTLDDNDNDINVDEMKEVITDLDKASSFNQGEGGSGGFHPRKQRQSPTKNKHWDVDFVRQTVDRYEHCLEQLYKERKTKILPETNNNDDKHNSDNKIITLFLSSHTTKDAFVALQRCRIPTSILSRRVRKWEKYIGSIGRTPITDELSLSLLEAHGKAGNVGRAVQMLTLRKDRQYPPTYSEFVYAITAIHAAGLSLRKNHKNVFLSEQDQPPIDDPTRWLDTILLNMNQRVFELTTSLANRMINTYASTGRSAKSQHFFYKVTRHPIDDYDYDDGIDGDNDDHQPKEQQHRSKIATQYGRPVKIRLQMRPPPPYHKVPSQVRGKLVRAAKAKTTTGFASTATTTATTTTRLDGEDDAVDSNGAATTEVRRQLKLDRELDPDWSPVLTAAMSFADSLQQGGACGHDPIRFDVISYTTLMKVCVYRGSLWRAMQILDEIMPNENIEPDIVSYNVLLDGLARVGDVSTSKEYYRKLLSNNLKPTKETIQAIVDGMLNLGDVGAAITFCQDSFNQHSVLPPYTTHLKIIEFALGRGLVFEAKRHVYFIQQLWKWQRNQYHSHDFVRLMELTQKNPKLSRRALEQLFAYFGEELTDDDFF